MRKGGMREARGERGGTAVILKSPEHPEMIPVARSNLSRYAGDLSVTTQCRSERT